MATVGPLTKAVNVALQAAQTAPQDAAAVELVRQYARLLDAATDDVETFNDLGPKLLAVLNALGMTLAGRSEKTKGGDKDVSTAQNTLAALRGERGAATRPRDTADLDAPAS